MPRISGSDYTQDEQDALVAGFFAGTSSSVVAEAIGTSSGAVRSFWRRHGLSGRDRRWSKIPNDYAFDDAEGSAEASYWVGFLLADGCVYDAGGGQPLIRVSLQRSDRQHLVKLAEFVGLDASAVTDGESGSKSQPNATLAFSSAVTAATLAKYGVVPRKTLTAEPSPLLTDSRDFWRGMVDGDGFVTTAVAKYRRGDADVAAFGLSGSEAVVREFARYVKAMLPRSRVTPCFVAESNCWKLSTRGQYAAAAVTHLYRDACVSLDRKQATADRIAKLGAAGVDGSPRRFLTHDGITLSIPAWAERLNIPAKRINVRLQRGWSIERTLTAPMRDYPARGGAVLAA